MPISEVTHEDNMVMMARYPDKFFDLALLDPEFGIGSPKNTKKHYSEYSKNKWNSNIPNEDYFKEVFRVSKNQIIWGGNYYTEYLPPTKSWIVWDKLISGDANGFADGEMAWTSFNYPLKIYKNRIQNQRGSIHPTQKPVSLYEWTLINFLNDGKSVIDTNMGSQSSRIACYNLGFDYYGVEINKLHFQNGCKRFEEHISQLTILHPCQ